MVHFLVAAIGSSWEMYACSTDECLFINVGDGFRQDTGNKKCSVSTSFIVRGAKSRGGHLTLLHDH